MQIEIIIVGMLIIFLMSYNGQFSVKALISDNMNIFRKLKEDDWDFYVRAKYGDNMNAEALFANRIRNGLITILVLIGLYCSTELL